MAYLLFYICALFLYCCNSYDNLYAKYMGNLSQSTYCVDTMDWKCLTCMPSIQLYNIIENRGVKLLVGMDDYSGGIFAAFRGSTNTMNWINNMKVQQISPWNNSVMVDKGFYQDYEYIKSQLYESLYTLSKMYNTSDVVLTGHSMGSVLTMLSAYEIIKFHDFTVKYLITFGSPRLGNMEFVNEMNGFILKLDIKSYRITHENDMVPHLPQNFMDYYHVTNEIWYNEPNTKYIVCNDTSQEDPMCSDSCAPYHCTSISDHLNYLNISFGSDSCF